MSEVNIESQILSLFAQCAALAVVISSTVAALRARIPRLDGWLVLVVSAALSLGLVALFVRPVDAASAVQYAQLVVFAWLIAIGVPALGARIAGKAKGTTVELKEK